MLKDKELEQLKKKLDNNPGLHTLEYVEEKFEKRLENIKETLEKVIKAECKNLAEKSYAEVAKSGTDSGSNACNTKGFREAIKYAWREENAEKDDRKKRAKNVIVHGVPEQSTEDDNSWATGLACDTHTKVNINRVIRLGKGDHEKKRPLLISLQSEDEKVKLLGNLSALKDYDKYKGMSVTEDLTPEERKFHKDLSTEAKQRNLSEKSTTEVWRVRGNSKNGFYLKKITFKSQ